VQKDTSPVQGNKGLISCRLSLDTVFGAYGLGYFRFVGKPKVMPMRKQVEAWKKSRLPNGSAKLGIYRGHISSLRVAFCCLGCPQNRDELLPGSNFLITFPLLKASL